MIECIDGFTALLDNLTCLFLGALVMLISVAVYYGANRK